MFWQQFMIMLTYHNIKLSIIANTNFTMLCQNGCHKTSSGNLKKMLLDINKIFWCCQNIKKKIANILTLADKCLKNQHIPLRLFILTEIEISGLKLICQNIFALSEWYHIFSQISVSGWASTPNSSIPHCIT